jgi:hypothetical protein
MTGTPIWTPTKFLRFEEAFDTSMGTAKIVTDAGRAYIKALGNRQGPHPLACEWVGTQLARWFGLPTLEFALLTIDSTVDEIPFRRGGIAASGTAFVTRAANGHPWGGDPEELKQLSNPDAVARLVVFDTWVRNCDRYPPDLTTRRPNYDNVFLEDQTDPVRTRLIAMDQTHCFTCGGDLNSHIAQIDLMKDDRLYGLFPGFRPLINEAWVDQAVAKLTRLEKDKVRAIVDSIPPDWEVNKAARAALIHLTVERGAFVADTIKTSIRKVCSPDKLFIDDAPTGKRKGRKKQ